MLSTASFNQAQTDVITCVETQVNNNSVFVSTSMDSEALIWDTRKNKPASGIFHFLVSLNFFFLQATRNFHVACHHIFNLTSLNFLFSAIILFYYFSC